VRIILGAVSMKLHHRYHLDIWKKTKKSSMVDAEPPPFAGLRDRA